MYNVELPDIRNILGWLTFVESTALQMCTWHCSGLPGDIVEIGSYCGKSAVVIGDSLKQGCSGILYCIDPHVGNIETYGVDSYTQLKNNIKKFELCEYIKVRQLYSHEISWDGSIKMLFIDADHSYKACKQDFTLFEHFVIQHGLIAFHDSHEAGPQQVIIEAMQTQKFHTLMIADSLTVLKKLL